MQGQPSKRDSEAQLHTQRKELSSFKYYSFDIQNEDVLEVQVLVAGYSEADPTGLRAGRMWAPSACVDSVTNHVDHLLLLIWRRTDGQWIVLPRQSARKAESTRKELFVDPHERHGPHHEPS